MSTNKKFKYPPSITPWLELPRDRDEIILSDRDYDRARICVNACAGIANPAEAIRLAREALAEAIDVVEGVMEGDTVDSFTTQPWKSALAAIGIKSKGRTQP